MKVKDTLFHINWGDGDTCFVIAPDEDIAKERMPEGKGMVNYIVKLDSLYQMIFLTGIKEVVEWIENHGGNLDGYRVEWQAKLKEWGI